MPVIIRLSSSSDSRTSSNSMTRRPHQSIGGLCLRHRLQYLMSRMKRRISVPTASSGVRTIRWVPLAASCMQIALFPDPFRPMISIFRPDTVAS